MQFEEKKQEGEEVKVAKVAETLEKAQPGGDMWQARPGKDVTGGQQPIAEKVEQLVAHWADDDGPDQNAEKSDKDDPEKGHEGAKKNLAFPEYKEGMKQDFVANSAGGPTQEIDIGMPETTPIGGTEMGGEGGGGGENKGGGGGSEGGAE